jgi:hypothetical protein
MAKNAKNATEVVATEVVANEVVNTSSRPRPEVVVFSEEVYFQSLDGTKWATLPYTMDGKTRVIQCNEVKDLTTLKGFKVGPDKYDIPQVEVVLQYTATYCEVAEDGQRFRGSKTFYKAVATFADGRVQEFNTTGDEIRKAVGLPVEGGDKTPVGIMLTWCEGLGKKQAAKIHNKTFQEKWGALVEDLKTLRQAEVEAKKAADAAKRAEAKAKAKDDADAKRVANASDMVLATEMARRMNITVEQALAMLGH